AGEAGKTASEKQRKPDQPRLLNRPQAALVLMILRTIYRFSGYRSIMSAVTTKPAKRALFIYDQRVTK
ncbi:MAG: hypothetical protein VW395_01755, partial [Methylotenera sp.]